MDLDSQSISRPYRKLLPHGTPPWVNDEAIFFITICCIPREANQLCHAATATSLFESIEFRAARGDWFVHLLVLMPDHLHGLISFPRERDMRKVVAGWKEITAKKTGVRWQRDFFDHRLRSNEGYEEKASYIRMNPVRAGLISESTAWPYVWSR
jgi:putative transposase